MQEWSLGLSTGQPSDRSVEERCGGAIAVVRRASRHILVPVIAWRTLWQIASPGRGLISPRARLIACGERIHATFAVRARSISSIVRPRVSKPMNQMASAPSTYQKAKKFMAGTNASSVAFGLT